MVKHKLKRILICEDDIELCRGFEDKFNQGINEINKTAYKKWDLLYLGCGNRCGDRDISHEKSRTVKHLSTLNQFMDGDDMYVKHPNDLRAPCIDGCTEISEHISIPEKAGGSWCYGISLSGAKKMLKLVGNDAGAHHIDHIYQQQKNNGGIRPLSFNPPIVWHEGGAIRSDTDIPWEY